MREDTSNCMKNVLNSFVQDVLFLLDRFGGEHMQDKDYMKRALELAAKGRGWTNPNPMVGAVIVKDGRIIGEGYHHKCGELHAERDALKNCTEDPKGATIYVTLEPCCHYGKQPPCVNAILEAGITKVVCGSGDPNPKVAGKGLQLLRDAGVEVVEHVLEDECLALNEIFFHYITTKRPYVALKYAMSRDGKIACATGESQWITGETARAHVHELRNAYAGILVGVGTVLQDNPQLTCRMEGGKNPVRIVCDTHLKTPLQATLVTTAKEVPTIIATAEQDKLKQQPYLDAGCEVLTLPLKEGHIDLEALLTELGKKELDSVLVEGGGRLNWSFVNQRLVQKVYTYVGANLFGGETALTPIEGEGFLNPAESLKLTNTRIQVFGEDVLLESEAE